MFWNNGASKSKIKNNQHGFSLIEILMAVGIFATAAGGILVGVNASLSTQARDEHLLQATWLAQNKMIEIESKIEVEREKGKFPDDQEENGTFEEPHDDIEWKAVMRKVEIPIGGEAMALAGPMKAVMQQVQKDINENLRELKLTVSWIDAEDDKPRQIVLTTHLVNFK